MESYNPAASDRPLRVALVTRSLMMGGAEHHIIKLCQTISRAEVELSIFLLVRDEPSDWLPEVPPDIPVFVSPLGRYDVRVVKWLADGLKARQVQVAHSFLWTADAITGLSSLLFARIPVVGSERGDRGYGGHYAPNGLFGRYDRWVTFRIATCFSPASRFGGKLLEERGYDPSRIRVIYNGVQLDRMDSESPIDLRLRLGWPANCRIVGTACALIPRKGVDSLIRALPLIHTSEPVFCAIVGDGPERVRLEELTRELGVADRVAFLGQHTPAHAFVKGFDIAILATNQPTEVCSNSILEYMACAKPVIATRIAGNPELVLSEETGLLTEPDNPAELARAIERLANDPGLATRMGHGGRDRIEQEFRMEVVAARSVQLWRSVASADSTARSGS